MNCLGNGAVIFFFCGQIYVTTAFVFIKVFGRVAISRKSVSERKVSCGNIYIDLHECSALLPRRQTVQLLSYL